ncbi:hypothetical protein GXW82_30365 [Streptacidiphilus sp. 4-A2]|nr:hypothetical protein [Streptacidiphilus sp. 4-A2]
MSPYQVTFTPTTLVTSSAFTWVGVYSLADLSADPQSVTVSNLPRPLTEASAAQVGSSVLTLGPVGGSLWSSPLNGGPSSTPLQLVQDQILETRTAARWSRAPRRRPPPGRGTGASTGSNPGAPPRSRRPRCSRRPCPASASPWTRAR